MLVVEGTADSLGDETTPLTHLDAPIELLEQVVVQAYVHTHGHILTHTCGSPAQDRPPSRIRSETPLTRGLEIALARWRGLDLSQRSSGYELEGLPLARYPTRARSSSVVEQDSQRGVAP